EEHDDSQSPDHGALAKTPRQSSRRLPTPPTTPARSKSSKKGKPQAILRSSTANWHTTWSTILEPYVNSSWAIGLNDVITRMFTYDGVDDLVRLLQDLYRTKDAIAINNATKSKASLKANDTDAPACDVVLRFKELWDAQESTGMSKIRELLAYHDLGQALHDLESQLDQINLVP
ncbi:hypothetical protein KCU67_g17941, partial [Aureobasidium melanogenum]